MGGAVGGVAGLGWVLRLGEGARRLARVRHPSSNGLRSVDIYVIRAQRGIQKPCAMAATSDSSLRCATFRMT